MSALAAILLAGGDSRRFGAADKLRAQIEGQPLIRRAAQTLLQSGVDGLVVVSGAHSYADVLAGLPLRIVHNAQWARGMGSSLAAGVRALTPAIAGTFIVPADMPRLAPPVFERLRTAFAESGGQRIVYPAAGPAGAQRNPVLWPRRFFPALAAIDGPHGAKPLLDTYRQETLAVPFGDETPFLDIDTAADLAALLAGA